MQNRGGGGGAEARGWECGGDTKESQNIDAKIGIFKNTKETVISISVKTRLSTVKLSEALDSQDRLIK